MHVLVQRGAKLLQNRTGVLKQLWYVIYRKFLCLDIIFVRFGYIFDLILYRWNKETETHFKYHAHVESVTHKLGRQAIYWPYHWPSRDQVWGWNMRWVEWILRFGAEPPLRGETSLLFIVIKINPTKIINECDHRVLSHWKDSGICVAAVGGLIILAVIQGVVCRRFLGVERGVRRRRGGHRGVRKGVIRVWGLVIVK